MLKKIIIYVLIISFIVASILPNILGDFNRSCYIFNDEKLNINNGLVGYWSFDEGTGSTAHDDSGNGNDGMINGATWIEGVLGKALDFDGNSDYVSFSSSVLDTPPFSVCAWVKPNTVNPSKNRYIIANGGHSLDKSGLYLALAENYTHHLFYQYQFGGTKINGDHGVAYKQATSTGWTFLCGTWDGSLNENNFRLYINGNRVSGVRIFPVTGGPSYHLRIGQPVGTSNYYWDGLIDEVRIYNRVLSENEILDLYKEPFKTSIFIGKINNLNTDAEKHITFNAEKLRIITFTPFQFLQYSSNEEIMILDEYIGFITQNFMIGFFKSIL